MNGIQSLFNRDERVIIRNRKKEIGLTLSYCLFSPRQWKYITPWIRSLRAGKTPYGDELPWVTYGAISFLNMVLTSDSKVFEYGSGGSTLFSAKRAKLLVSVEHDEGWYKLLQGELKRRGIKNVNYLLKKSKKLKDNEALHEYFRSWREQGVSFKDYVEAINDYDDDYFDVVLVDGRTRVACAKEAYSKVRNGGFVLLDNSERKDYYEAHLFFKDKGCEPMNFFGLVGYETLLSQTTIWKINK